MSWVGRLGYSREQIARLENGSRLPDLAVIAALFVPALFQQQEMHLVEQFLALAGRTRTDQQITITHTRETRLQLTSETIVGARRAAAPAARPALAADWPGRRRGRPARLAADDPLDHRGGGAGHRQEPVGSGSGQPGRALFRRWRRLHSPGRRCLDRRRAVCRLALAGPDPFAQPIGRAGHRGLSGRTPAVAGRRQLRTHSGQHAFSSPIGWPGRPT